jgi:hypothetical protein
MGSNTAASSIGTQFLSAHNRVSSKNVSSDKDFARTSAAASGEGDFYVNVVEIIDNYQRMFENEWVNFALELLLNLHLRCIENGCLWKYANFGIIH